MGNFFKSKFWNVLFSPAKNLASLVAAICTSMILIAAMGGTIFLSSKLSVGSARNLAVIFSSIACAVLSVPLTLIWTPRLRELIRKTDDKNQIIIGEQRAEINELKSIVKNQQTNEGKLQDKIHLLENLVFSSQSSVDILKVGYKEYTKSSTIRMKKKINETHGSLFLHSGFDEAVLILDCKIKYQRGIDFKNLRLNYLGTNRDAVVVTNLKPEYTSAPVFEYETFLREIRHVDTDKNQNEKKIHIVKNAETENQLNEIERQCKADFESSFQSDENSESLEETNEILKISKDCIRLLLRPYFSKIEFDSYCEIKDSKPWTEFLQQQIEIYKGQNSSKKLETK